MLRSLTVLFVCLAVFAICPAPEAHANGILVTTEPGTPDIGLRHDPRRTPHISLPPHRRPPVVRLQGHTVKAQINDRIASVTVEQVFRNHSSRQLEGTYLFPLPEGAVVSKFAMTMFGKMVQGEIIERNEARRIYQSIVSRRRDPGLLEYMGRGLFRAKVFPIEPRKDLTIRLTYQQVLPEDAGTLEFRYPLATDRLNITPVKSVVLDVKVNSSVDIKAIYSPSHRVEVKREGERRARVSYERSARRQDKDLLLYVGRSADAVGFSLLGHKEAGRDGTFMAVFAPRTEARHRVPKDVVYVVDKSGSMAGPKMEQAKKAIQYGVRMLRDGDRFNVLAFSTNLYPFRDGLVSASGEMKEAAVKYIDGLEPTGGTNIDGALQDALKMRSGDRLFMVVFITDGKPTVQERDPERIVKNVKGAMRAANSANTRIFTFGVGYDLDVKLLDRVAEATRGSRDYVTPGEDLEVVTGRFFRKVDQPVLTNIKLELGDGVYDVYPSKLPDLFAGGQITVFGRYKQSGKRTILLRGKLGDKEVVHEHNAAFSDKDNAAYLPRLWASRKIGFMLDEIRLHGENKELVDEIVRLATKHAIVTPYTAGLVVEESELDGLPALRSARMRFERETGGKRRLGGLLPADLPVPGAGALPTPRTPAPEPAAKKTADSEEIRRLKEAASGEEDAGDARSSGRYYDEVRRALKHVEGKVFVRDAKGRWIDKAWTKGKPTVKVVAFSETYFELMQSSDKIAKYLALGDRVTFVHAGTAYEVVPAP